MPTRTPFTFLEAPHTISPLGVGENGQTTYVEEAILTEVVAVFSDSISTITVPPPTTMTCKHLFNILNEHMVEVNPVLIEDTVEEDASGLLLHASIINPGDSVLPSYMGTESCSFQGTTALSCVLALDFP
jgi:hypothetical protein